MHQCEGREKQLWTHIDDEIRGEERNDFENMLSFFMDSADDINENNIEVETALYVYHDVSAESVLTSTRTVLKRRHNILLVTVLKNLRTSHLKK